MALNRPSGTTADGCEAEQRHQRPGLSAWILVPMALIFIAIAGVYAFSITFSQFASYDDQGTMMVCIRGYLEGHPLYDSVRLMYGPFYFIYEAMLHTLTSLPVTHDVTGIICIIHWLGAAGVLALAGGLMTRSAVMGVFIFMQATIHLQHVAREPGHPQELVILALALAVLVVATGSQRRWTLALLGTIGAALVFTKINVGAFFGVALLMALSSYAPFLQARPGLFWGLLLMCGSLPFLLIREHLGEAWVRDCGSVVSAGVMAAGAFTYTLAGERRLGFCAWLQTGIPFGVVSVLLMLAVLANGTSLSGMVDSTVRVAASLPGNTHFSLIIPNGAWSAATALLTAVVALRFRASWQRFNLAIAALKGCYGLLGSALFLGETRIQLGYLLPWFWLVLIQVPKNSRGQPADLFPRAVLCLLAAWQGLQAYPVPYTQVSVATFLAVLAYSICLHDALAALAAAPRVNDCLRLLTPRTALRLHGLVLGGLLLLFVVQSLWRWADYASVPPLRLRGANYLRLPAPQAEAYLTLVRYLERECDTFIATPLLNSLYLWTNKRPPTWFNVNGSGIPSGFGQQAQVVAALQNAKHPLILVRESQVPYLLGAQSDAHGPLIHYMREDCLEIKRIGRFRILAPKGLPDRLATLP